MGVFDFFVRAKAIVITVRVIGLEAIMIRTRKMLTFTLVMFLMSLMPRSPLQDLYLRTALLELRHRARRQRSLIQKGYARHREKR